MTDPMSISDALQVIGRHWHESSSPEQKRILSFAQDALVFISETGQWYPVQDFRERRTPPADASDFNEGAGEWNARLSQTARFFEKLLADTSSDDERGHIRFILEVLQFIASTQQTEALGAFIQRTEAHAPPMVVASFETAEQAEAWLKNHPNPPAFAEVLIGDRYHDVVYDRETNFRRLPWNRHFEHYLGWLERHDPPVAQASFATRGEAETWLNHQAHPPAKAWVSIAGEFYLAVFHANVNHRALYPLSMADRTALE